MSSDTKIDWTSAPSHGTFGKLSDADEYFHGWGPLGDSLTETWFWSFNVPEAAINCIVYCWVHPNLDVVTVGVVLNRGITQHHLAADIFDVPIFLKASTVVGEGRRIQVPNGLVVEVIDPLRHIHLSYTDTGRDSSFEVDLRAAADPVVRANNLHFEQLMHATGSLRLRGEAFEVDSYSIRDRSWGELRPEAHNAHGPYNWITGAAADGSWAFNVGTLDLPGASAEQKFRDGWLSYAGRLTRLVATNRVIHRTADGRPSGHQFTLTDVEGRSLDVTGEIVASIPWGGWHNAVVHLGLTKWSLSDGSIGWGESQDVQWNDHVRAFHSRAQSKAE